MERKIRWNLTEDNFKEMKEILSADSVPTNDYIGSVEIGELSVEFILRDYNRIKLDYDVFVGGVDRGYGETSEGNLPYDLADGGCLNERAIKTIETLEEFKKYALRVVEKYIDNDKKYNVNGVTLAAKANSEKFFDWN